MIASNKTGTITMQPAKHTSINSVLTILISENGELLAANSYSDRVPCLIDGKISVMYREQLPDDLPPVEMCNRAAFVRTELSKRNIPAIENFFSKQNKKGPSNV